jgi:hypothetical protein
MESLNLIKYLTEIGTREAAPVLGYLSEPFLINIRVFSGRRYTGQGS